MYDFVTPTKCPNCQKIVVMTEFTYDAIMAKWGREDVAEHEHVRCPECLATFYRSAIPHED